MATSGSPISRRGAILAGSAAVAAGLTAAGPAHAEGHSAYRAKRRPILLPEQLAGQRVIYSYHGLTPPQSLLDLIRAGQVGGVIFFGENISGLTQIASVVQQLNDARKASPITAPLLLMTDQEGGLVRRLPGAPTLSEKKVGLAADPVGAATDAGTGAGHNLAGVGMNVNLAPVLDVYRTPGDFEDQFQRSYSQDPAVCSSLGSAFITAHQKTGVAATAKHFPGLGAASKAQNTDLTKVTLDLPLSELRDKDESPYTAAIDAGVKLVMLSWGVYPALDPDYPAGLSRRIIQGELRGRLGFRGVTITDALEAGALANFGASDQRGLLAAKAGADLLLCSARDVSQGQSTVTALAGALRDGTIGAGEFAASLLRVTTLRTSFA
jgi:beta-N-acetylhexosaminidase